MSKRDIILFDIGRKTTGFSEKKLTAIHNFTSIPAPSFGQHTEQTSHFLDGFHMEYTMMGLSKLPAASSGSGLYLENPYIRVSLYENHSHLGGYITGFDSNVKGFFGLFLPYFALFFLTFHVEPVILAM